MSRKYAVGALTLATLGLTLYPISVRAQSGSRNITSPDQQETQLISLTNTVGLTPEQSTKVHMINADAMKKTLDVRNSGDDPSSTAARIKIIQRDQRASIRELLTPEQKEKYEAYLTSMNLSNAH